MNERRHRLEIIKMNQIRRDVHVHDEVAWRDRGEHETAPSLPEVVQNISNARGIGGAESDLRACYAP